MGAAMPLSVGRWLPIKHNVAWTATATLNLQVVSLFLIPHPSSRKAGAAVPLSVGGGWVSI